MLQESGYRRPDDGALSGFLSNPIGARGLGMAESGRPTVSPCAEGPDLGSKSGTAHSKEGRVASTAISLSGVKGINFRYRGWAVLAGLFFCYAATNGILLNTMPLFYPKLMQEFGWSTQDVTLPAIVFSLVAAGAAPLMGLALDRWSPRAVMLIGVVCIVVGLGLFSQLQSLAEMIVIYVFLALALVMGGLLPSMFLVARWFVRQRGIAAGILLMASSAGGGFFPLLVKNTFATSGWRDAVVLMTVVGAAMMLLSVVLLVRNHPRDLGLLPDGANREPLPQETPENPRAVAGGPTLGQALRIPNFYFLMFATAAMWFCINGVVNHQAIYFSKDLGFADAELPILMSVFFWCAVIGKFAFGVLSDYFKKGHIMLLATINMALGLVLFRFVTDDNMLVTYGYAAVYGIGFSGAFTMIQLMIAELFAGRAYGNILGLFVCVDTLAGAAGIRVLATMRDRLGDYGKSIDVMIALCVAAALCVVVINLQSARARASATA